MATALETEARNLHALFFDDCSDEQWVKIRAHYMQPERISYLREAHFALRATIIFTVAPLSTDHSKLKTKH